MSTDDTPTTTPTGPQPVGRREERGGSAAVVIERTFQAPVEDVWAAVTEPERLERWIGTWSGDPASGTVEFRMTAEGEDVAPETVTVHECDPPRRLVLSWVPSMPPSGTWHVELDLDEADGRTTLTFAQRVPDLATGRDVGPGWEYYLDRLEAELTGTEVSAVVWPDYEGMAGHYERLFTDLG